ncbi:hypothetical protein LJS80_004899 [Salmonella enterica]|nr:hypothetical protein [Salmonella enterica]EIK0391327.1 hypothetical protein [Salmonella enterica]
MQILIYQSLEPSAIPGFERFSRAVRQNDFRAADARKIDSNLYRVRLGRRARLLFSLYRYHQEVYCLVLEYLPDHRYDRSRFLHQSVNVDDMKCAPLNDNDIDASPALSYVNPRNPRFVIQDKVISFDDEQQAVCDMPLPVVISGPAGSGKTAILLEKMKQAGSASVLYVSLSPWLVSSVRQLFYAGERELTGDEPNVTFLSFREFIESLSVPEGREVTVAEFERWFSRRSRGTPFRSAHAMLEEFRGVLGAGINAVLSAEEYLNLGLRQSVFPPEQRAEVYGLFERYRLWLKQGALYDLNLLSHQYSGRVSPVYDVVLIDEVQDMTVVQIHLLLQSLKTPGNFLLCGDANQIVHPNFFSWSALKKLFFEHRRLMSGECLHILNSGYRNAPRITRLAGQLLRLRQRRFGSVDRESDYRPESRSGQQGNIILLPDSDENCHQFNEKTGRSVRHAVIVMHAEQKSLARRIFSTPLVFSVQEIKGLEYENVILFRMVSAESRMFREICGDLLPGDLQQPGKYSRGKDKHDRSIEVYKFYINALYVALTRSTRNVYLLESELQHPLFSLLELRGREKEALQAEVSSREAWQQQASQLQQQGKDEQARLIRDEVLHQESVPWKVISRERYREMVSQPLTDKNQQLFMMEYAIIYNFAPLLSRLWLEEFKPARQPPEKTGRQLEQKYFRDYGMRNPVTVLRDTDKYGVDYRNRFNLTPLMMAVRAGNPALAETLLKSGADPQLRGSDGLSAWHTVLWQTVCDARFARQKCAALYRLVCPSGVSVRTDNTLKIIDSHHPVFFLLNLMIALFYIRLGPFLSEWRAYTAKDLADDCVNFPAGVVPERRRKQKYISGLLSRHEAGRDGEDNWRLFRRLRHGHYIINPDVYLRYGEGWIAVYDLLGIPELGTDIRQMPFLQDEAFLRRYGIDVQQLVADRQMNINVQMDSIHGRRPVA